MAGASPASTPCAAPAVIRCSASLPRQYSIRLSRCRISRISWSFSGPATSSSSVRWTRPNTGKSRTKSKRVPSSTGKRPSSSIYSGRWSIRPTTTGRFWGSSMAFEILEPGLATTVQDQGRFGYYNVGIPQGGAMDGLSAEMANALAGNTPAEAVLECTYMGPRFRTDAAAVIAVTGAPVDVKVNGEARGQWSRLELDAGDEVSFGILKGGTRFYIAVHGGVDVPVVLGSRSTYGLGGIGGFDGRPLRAGDL